MKIQNQNGFTLIEALVTLVIAGVLASAFVSLVIPQANLFFYMPQRLRVQNAAQDVLSLIIEGDSRGLGLRFSNAISAPSATSVSYTYFSDDFTSHTVVLTYDSTNKVVTRQIDGGTAENIPYYLKTTSGMTINPAETNFFRYYDSGDTEMTGGGIVTASVYRIDVALTAASGTGKVTDSEGNFLVKSGVEIKRYTT